MNMRKLLFCILSIHLICSTLVAQSTQLKSQAEKWVQKGRDFINIDADSSLFYAKLSLQQAINERNEEVESRAFALFGEVYQVQSKFKESVDNYLKAIRLGEKNNDKKSLSSFYNGLGITYYLQGDFAKSEKYIQKAIQLKLELKDYTYYSILTTNLAGIYFYQERYKDAISLLRKAEKVILNEKKDNYLGNVYNSLGGIYTMYSAQYDSAQYYYEKSLAISKATNSLDNIISTYHNLGDLQIRKGNYAAAIPYLKEGEKITKSLNRDALTLKMYETLSEAYDSLRDYKQAYYYKQKQLDLRNEIFADEKQKAVSELEIKYETSKKEEELKEARLATEKAKNRMYVIVFIAVVIILIVLFILIFIRNKRKNEIILQHEKSKIFENIVHDIRTPLTLINGPLQLIKNEVHDPKFVEYAQIMENNSNKLMTLVNELLDASKLQKGKFEVSYSMGNPVVLTKQILTDFQTEINKKEGELIFNCTISEQVNFYFPQQIFEKVLQNLLANAIKYSSSPCTIEVDLIVEHENLILQVKDTGFGIPKEHWKNIFERFYRLDRDKNTSGTGIGLSLVKEMLQVANGTISIVKSDQQGTTFECVLPIKMEEKVVISESENEESLPVLVLIEDDADLLSFVTKILSPSWKIITATTGNEGLSTVQQILPDLVLSDVMLPFLSGLEITKQLKSSALTNHIPVVLFSAKSSIESRLEGLELGADAYLSKPFNPDELKLILNNLLQTKIRNQQDFQAKLKQDVTFEKRVSSKHSFVNDCISGLIKNMDNSEYSVNELAEDMCVSRSQLHRKLSTLTGLSTSNFIKMVRIEFAKDLLKNTSLTITEIAYQTGFNSQSYFTKSFTEYVGESPTKFSERKI
jgi:signal transduction histidine kinase/DNA-binding response OmpR family regulator